MIHIQNHYPGSVETFTWEEGRKCIWSATLNLRESPNVVTIRHYCDTRKTRLQPCTVLAFTVRDMETGVTFDRLCVIWHYMKNNTADVVPVLSTSSSVAPGTYKILGVRPAQCSSVVSNMNNTSKHHSCKLPLNSCSRKRMWVMREHQAEEIQSDLYTEEDACKAYIENVLWYTKETRDKFTIYHEKELFGIYPGVAAINDRRGTVRCLFCQTRHDSLSKYKQHCGTQY